MKVNEVGSDAGTLAYFNNSIHAEETKRRLCYTCYFPDEIWFCIYNILFFDIFSAEETRSESQNSSLQCFYGMVLISKTDYARLLRYLKQKPQIVSFGCACCSNKWLKKIVWVGKKSVKLSDLTINVNFDDNDAMNIYFHLLQSCNIIEMQTLTIVQFSSEAQFSRHLRHRSLTGGRNRRSIKSDFSSDFSSNVISQVHAPMIARDFLTLLAAYVSSKCLQLNKMILVFLTKRDFHRPLRFITAFSETLKILHLRIKTDLGSTGSRGSFDLQSISQAIEEMKLLNTLVLHIQFETSLRIKSASLQTIDTTKSMLGFSIDQCLCPSLIMIRFNYGISVIGETGDETNGLKPLRRKMLMSARNDYDGMPNQNADSVRVVDFVAGDCPFIGMNVPDNCIVRVGIERAWQDAVKTVVRTDISI